MRQDPQTPIALNEVATGTALRDLIVNSTDFAENGMTQIGAPVVVSATLTAVDMAASPPSMTALVCLDYAGVDVVAPDGTSVKSPDAPSRVPTILTLVQMDTRWLVADRSFPEEPTC